MVVCLKTQLQEEESTGPVPLGPDLLSVLEDVKTWCLRMIRAGETNIKCYLLMSIIVKQFKARRQARDGAGFDDGESLSLMMQATEEAEATCLGILKEIPAKGGQAIVNFQGQEAGCSDIAIENEVGSMELNMPSELMQDPNFMVSRKGNMLVRIWLKLSQTSDALFNFDPAEPMGWLFGNGSTEWSTIW